MDQTHITHKGEQAYFCPKTWDLSNTEKEWYEEVKLKKELRLFNTAEVRELIKNLIAKMIK